MRNPIATFTHNGYEVNIYTEEHTESPRRQFDRVCNMYAFSRDYQSPDHHSFHDQGDMIMNLLTFKEPKLTRYHGDNECDYSSEKADWYYLDPTEHLCCDDEKDSLMNELEDKYVNLYVPDDLLIYQLSFGYQWGSVGMSEYDPNTAEEADGFVFITGHDICLNYGNPSADPDLWDHIEKSGWKLSEIPQVWIERARLLLKSEVHEFNCYLEGEVYTIEVIDPEGNHVDSCGGFYGYDYVMKDETWMELVPDDPYVPSLDITITIDQRNVVRILDRITEIPQVFFNGADAELVNDVLLLTRATRKTIRKINEDV